MAQKKSIMALLPQPFQNTLRWLTLLSLATLLLSPLVGKEDTPAAPSPLSNDPAKLINQLASPIYLTRKNATETLWKMGTSALPALKKSLQGDHPEIAFRAKELILYISAGVLFDSPKEVKKLVLQYSQSKPEDKTIILKKLARLGQWKQVLHLAELEKDPDTQARISNIVQASALGAARNAIAQENYTLANDILQLAAKNPSTSLSYAWYLYHQGKLTHSLKEASPLWKLHLYRASGNLPEAITAAEQAGNNSVADALRILQGNPLPWLEHTLQNSAKDPIYATSCQIQIAKLKGHNKKADSFAKELKRLSKNEDDTSRVITSLAINGYRKEAISRLIKHDPDAAFFYYEAIDTPEHCIPLLGIPSDSKPPYTQWVKKTTQVAIADDDDVLYERLLTLASFLNSKGYPDHATTVLTPLMSALEKDGSDAWYDILGKMTDYGLSIQALQFVEKRGPEDDAYHTAIAHLLLNIPDEDLANIWSALKAQHPNDPFQTFRDVTLLSGQRPDPDHLTDKIHERLLAEVKGKNKSTQDARVSALFHLALHRHALPTAARLADRIAEKNPTWKNIQIYMLSSLRRWEKLATLCAAIHQKTPGDLNNLTRYYIALRGLGETKKASAIFKKILLISLGDPETLNNIASVINRAGFSEKATELWQSALRMSTPGSLQFDNSINYLLFYTSSLYKKNQWLVTSSIAEVAAQLTMRGQSNIRLYDALQIRFNADFPRGMHLLQSGHRSAAIAQLDTAHNLIPGAGILAEDFFPSLRNAGVDEKYEQWFTQSYQNMEHACRFYPLDHNTHNTTAWLASRSLRKLDSALIHAKTALSLRPNQAAYLDTMAEIYFAKGDREKAIQWSEKAVAASTAHPNGHPQKQSSVFSNYTQLSIQLKRFKTSPLPQ